MVDAANEEFKNLILKKDEIQKLLPGFIKLESLLAPGGQGLVYRGTFKNKPAAIKFYFPDQLQKRIDRETEALKTINNPNIVKFLFSDQFSCNGFETTMVITELVSGESLHNILQKKRLSENEISNLAWDVTNAIKAMWDLRIVHRDLKPSNILINSDQEAVVIDLGLARHVDKSPLTSFGVSWGTIGYLSPEQMHGVQQLTCKSDIFTLGIVILECLQGKHPTRGDQAKLILLNLHRTLPTGVTWEYLTLLQSFLNPDPVQRPRPTQILDILKEHSLINRRK
jgi:serine/threonine-protein kinase